MRVNVRIHVSLGVVKAPIHQHGGHSSPSFLPSFLGHVTVLTPSVAARGHRGGHAGQVQRGVEGASHETEAEERP